MRLTVAVAINISPTIKTASPTLNQTVYHAWLIYISKSIKFIYEYQIIAEDTQPKAVPKYCIFIRHVGSADYRHRIPRTASQDNKQDYID